VGLDRVRQTIKYRHALTCEEKSEWIQAAAAEFQRLISDTKSMHFIDPKSKPRNRTASYYNPQCQIKIKEGKKVYRVRGTYGGNVTDYQGDTTAWTADLETVKILLNAVVSEEESEWMTIDIKDFYLGTPLSSPEYMWIDLWQIPPETVAAYSKSIVIVNGKAMVEIVKGIYGLPHAGKIAQDRLISHLESCGFIQSTNTTCFFTHVSKPIAFTLVVDDFGVKYKGAENADYLLTSLQSLYEVTVDWSGSRYLGMHINRDRLNNTISISMPDYVLQALKRLGIQKSNHLTTSPSKFIPPKYGERVQYAHSDTSEILSQEKIKFIQRVCGIFLYYARAVDPTMLTICTSETDN
jgi:hypothetical protein